MKKIGKIELTSRRHIRNFCFAEGYAGGCAKVAMSIMMKQPEIEDYLYRDDQGGYSFRPCVLFDIMIDPESKRQYAVFIDDLFDEYSDVLTLEVKR